MSGPKACLLAALLALIGSQSVLAGSVAPKTGQQGQPAASNKAQLAREQYQVPHQGGSYEVPDAVGRTPQYSYNQGDRQQRPEEQYSSYQGPRDGGYEQEYPAEGPKGPYEPAPHDEGYELPKPSSKPPPCPKAMSADAVEDVLLSKGTFCWGDLAGSSSDKRARHVRKPSKSGSEAKQEVKAQQTQPEPSTATVSTASVDLNPAAGAAYRAEVSADSDFVGIASVSRVLADGANADQASTQQSSKAQEGDGEGPYGKKYPGMADPEFLLPVGPEVSGNGEYGTWSGDMVPTAESLAVGPHGDNPTVATLLHSVNAVAEILHMSKKGGKAIKMRTGTKIKLVDIAKQARRPEEEIEKNLLMGDPSAFYDCKDERWVLIWSSYPNPDVEDNRVTASLFVAVSHTIDPLENWTVYALEARPLLAPGWRHCSAGGSSFSPLAPQTTYSHDGIFISIGASCTPPTNGKSMSSTSPGIQSTLFAYSKGAFYDVDAKHPEIYAATYLGSGAWKSSITYKEQALIKEDYRTFNNLITPARPQEPEDVDQAPLFVMKVDGAYMSVATMTEEPLDKMDCISNAPSIRAIIVGKGEDFSNTEGRPDGSPHMPQPETEVVLDSGDTGMLGGKYGIRTYGTVQHKGLLYTTMSEFFGLEDVRMPSIYWAIIATHPGSGLCKAARKKWGFIASEDGLALAYPVVAARHDGSALVVYSYSGKGELPHSLGPAYPGVASSVVGAAKGYGYEKAPSIDIIELGAASITQAGAEPPEDEQVEVARWGDYSASQVFGGYMWFAVPVAKELDAGDDYREAWRSWIAVEEL